MTSPTPRRGRQPDLAARAERRAQILEAAERCFIRKGFHAASTAEISAEAQISVAGLYQHFPSKDDLILALIEKDLAVSIGWIEKIAAGDEFFSTVEHEMAASMKESVADGSSRIRMEIVAEATRSPVVASMLAEADAKMVQAVARVFADAQVRHQANVKLDPDAVAIAACCLLDGLHARLSFPSATHERLLAACTGLLRLTIT